MRLRDMQILSVAYLLVTLLPAGGFSLCLVYNTTGLPCPGCGMTRAIHHLLLGEWLEAFRSNAISFLLTPVLLFFSSTIVWKGGARFFEARRRWFGAGISAGAVLLLAYGAIRFAVLSGICPGCLAFLDEYFARFSEPVLLQKIMPMFFH